MPLYTASHECEYMKTSNKTSYGLGYRCYINTYGMNDYTLTCLVDKLLGRDTFRGKDPVDSFCGKWDTHL